MKLEKEKPNEHREPTDDEFGKGPQEPLNYRTAQECNKELWKEHGGLVFAKYGHNLEEHFSATRMNRLVMRMLHKEQKDDPSLAYDPKDNDHMNHRKKRLLKNIVSESG